MQKGVYDLILGITSIFIFIMLSFYVEEMVFFAVVPLIISFFLFFIILQTKSKPNTFTSSLKFSFNFILVVLIIFVIIFYKGSLLTMYSDYSQLFALVVILIIVGLLTGISLGIAKFFFGER